MQTQLAPQFINTPEGVEAAHILGKCVHCGFCTATCPTYQLLGDELDGPRGRIYLIKQMAEGQAPTEKTRLHLDRCLTCRNCESTCPSGVQYGNLIDIGRKWAEENTPARPLSQRLTRWALKEGLTSPRLFNSAMTLGRLVRPLMPASIQRKIPLVKNTGLANATDPYQRPQTSHSRKMLLLEGCVQPGMLPNINSATARVLDALKIQLVSAPNATCCGALRHHLNDQEGAVANVKQNIDAWWPLVEAGAEAIVMTASGCGVMVKDYGHLLANDPTYAAKAQSISKLTKDISEILPLLQNELIELVGSDPKPGVVYHPPCTLQHGQQIRGKVEGLLTSLGVGVRLCADSHLCCGSAGTYSVTQPELSEQLRTQKLQHLNAACEESGADVIVSGNVGCIAHLQQKNTPVLHWIEMVDQLVSQKNTAH
ncbi:glycolate oxidase iron-sulfur subunit [Polynucleobacter meluiroseus]|uniref:Glycolate oxidase iron-sulfur subunit n=1 Tax=Polynucleobacter meluiroseus TaxID=1938814 RepID=A0A240DXN6_9BURK|nr:glycolate oxidase subunit GlcF [Polynucleobacter meluiroseus]SNX27958.1 glycolate oxidase iron-sulfur subunit [Polynucleobacter meluiroseus]